MRELLARIESVELAEWVEYYRIIDGEAAAAQAAWQGARPAGRQVNRRGLGPPR